MENVFFTDFDQTTLNGLDFVVSQFNKKHKNLNIPHMMSRIFWFEAGYGTSLSYSKYSIESEENQKKKKGQIFYLQELNSPLVKLFVK